MIRAIYAADGGRGFMRGATARMLYYVPSAAICWSVRARGHRWTAVRIFENDVVA